MKILVAYTGGLDVDKAVLDVARKHAKAFNATLYVASSMERVSEKERPDLDKIEKQLDYVKETVKSEGIACETHILVRGLTPGEDIVTLRKTIKWMKLLSVLRKNPRSANFFLDQTRSILFLNRPVR
jgi:hypothetical protein